MAFKFPDGLAPILSRAFQSGAEVTLRELGRLLATDGDVLTVAGAAQLFADQFELELLPSVANGDFDTTRVLRRRSDEHSSEERAKAIAAKGEGSRIEYKSSLLCSMHHWNTKSQLIELPSLAGEVLKTICAFLNTDGGDLLVGVDDTGTPCEGVENDLRIRGWDLDRWQLYLTTLVHGRFHQGDQISSYLRINAVELDSSAVVHIEVLAREQRSFVQRDKDRPYEFFVRLGSRTDSLLLPAFYSHLIARETQT